MRRSPIAALLILLSILLLGIACSKADDLNVVESDFVLQGTMTLTSGMEAEKIQCSVIDLDGHRTAANAFKIDTKGIFQFVVPTRFLIKDLADSSIIRQTTFTQETPKLVELANRRHLEKPIAIIRYECVHNPSEVKIGKILYHQDFAIIAKNSIWKGGVLDLGIIDFVEAGIGHVTILDEAKKTVTGVKVMPLSYTNDSTLQLWQDPQYGPVAEESDEEGEAPVFPLSLNAEKGKKRQFQILAAHEKYCLASTVPEVFDPESNSSIVIQLKAISRCPQKDVPGLLKVGFPEDVMTGSVGGKSVGFINTATFELTVDAGSSKLRPFDVSIYKGHTTKKSALMSTERISGFMSRISLQLPPGMLSAGETTDFTVSILSALSESEIAEHGAPKAILLYAQYLVQDVAVDASLATISGPGARTKIISGLADTTFTFAFADCESFSKLALLDSADSDGENIHFVDCSKSGTKYPMSELNILKNPGVGGFRDLIVLGKDSYGNLSDRTDENSWIYNVYVDYGVPDLTLNGLVNDSTITNLGSFGVALKTAEKGSDSSPHSFDAGIFLSSENLGDHVLRFDRPGSCKLLSQTPEDGSGTSDLGHHVGGVAIAKTKADAESAAFVACGDDLPLVASAFSAPASSSDPAIFYLRVKDLAGHASEAVAHEIQNCYKDGSSQVGDQLCWCSNPSGATCLPD